IHLDLRIDRAVHSCASKEVCRFDSVVHAAWRGLLTALQLGHVRVFSHHSSTDDARCDGVGARVEIRHTRRAWCLVSRVLRKRSQKQSLFRYAELLRRSDLLLIWKCSSPATVWSEVL